MRGSRKGAGRGGGDRKSQGLLRSTQTRNGNKSEFSFMAAERNETGNLLSAAAAAASAAARADISQNDVCILWGFLQLSILVVVCVVWLIWPYS